MGTEIRTTEAAAQLRRDALAMLTRHEHSMEFRDAEDEELTRRNCGACALTGYFPVTDEGAPHPNHAGWARVFVQAGRAVPAVFAEAFEDERVDKNTQYARELAIDIATYGVTFAAAPRE